MVEGVFHFNVVCSDLDRTLPFYEMLGFRVIADFREGMRSPELATGLGLPEARIRGVHLAIPTDPAGTRIDLLEFLDPKTDGKPYPNLYHAGICRVALKTTNLRQVYEDLKGKGVQFLSEPVTLPGTTFTFVCFPDPDGTIMELVEGSLG